MNLINNSIVFNKNVVNLFSNLHIYRYALGRVLQTYIFTDIFSTDLKSEHRIFLYGDIVIGSCRSKIIFHKGILSVAKRS